MEQASVTKSNASKEKDRTIVIIGLRPRTDIPWLYALTYKVPKPIESIDKDFPALLEEFSSHNISYASNKPIIPWFNSDTKSYTLTQEDGAKVEISLGSEAHKICDKHLKTVGEELGITRIVLIESNDIVSQLKNKKQEHKILNEFTHMIGVPNAIRATNQDIDNIDKAMRENGIVLSDKDIIVSGGFGDSHLNAVEQLSERYNAAPASCNGNWNIDKEKQYKILQKCQDIKLPLGEIVELPLGEIDEAAALKKVEEALGKIPPLDEQDEPQQYFMKPADGSGSVGALDGTKEDILENFLLARKKMTSPKKFVFQQYLRDGQEYSVYGTLCEEAVVQSDDILDPLAKTEFQKLCAEDSTLTFKRNHQKQDQAFIFDTQGKIKESLLDLNSDLGKEVNKLFRKEIKIHSILKPNVSKTEDNDLGNNGHIASQPDIKNSKHENICNFTRQIMDNLEDFRTGAFHLDLIRLNNVNYFLETTLRPGGSTHASDAVTASSPLEVETLYHLCGKIPPKWKNPKATLAAGYLSDVHDHERDFIKDLESNPNLSIKIFEKLYEHKAATPRVLIISHEKKQKKTIEEALEHITQNRETTITRASSILGASFSSAMDITPRATPRTTPFLDTGYFTLSSDAETQHNTADSIDSLALGDGARTSHERPTLNHLPTIDEVASPVGSPANPSFPTQAYNILSTIEGTSGVPAEERAGRAPHDATMSRGNRHATTPANIFIHQVEDFNTDATPHSQAAMFRYYNSNVPKKLTKNDELTGTLIRLTPNRFILCSALDPLVDKKSSNATKFYSDRKINAESMLRRSITPRISTRRLSQEPGNMNTGNTVESQNIEPASCDHPNFSAEEIKGDTFSSTWFTLTENTSLRSKDLVKFLGKKIRIKIISDSEGPKVKIEPLEQQRHPNTR